MLKSGTPQLYTPRTPQRPAVCASVLFRIHPDRVVAYFLAVFERIQPGDDERQPVRIVAAGLLYFDQQAPIFRLQRQRLAHPDGKAPRPAPDGPRLPYLDLELR